MMYQRRRMHSKRFRAREVRVLVLANVPFSSLSTALGDEQRLGSVSDSSIAEAQLWMSD